MNTMHERLLALLGMEPLILLLLMPVIAYVVYKTFLRNVNPERHLNLKNLFREVSITGVAFLACWVFQFLIQQGLVPFEHIFDYLGVASVILGALLFVRSVKIFVFEYLFLNSMKVGVPVLLVNLVTLMISIFIAAWISTSVFGVRWAPLLATSAFVSVVMGLALQDTLGNLFSGVALQFDKPYEIGDWIEIHGQSGDFTGEVYEITWRATTLYGLMDEVITVPNRVIGQSEVSNFSARKKPIYRALSIYLDVDPDENKIKDIFVKVLKETPGVLQTHDHFVMLRDLNEKGAHWRLAYPIVHFARQFMIVDDLLMRMQAEFKKAGITLARLRVDVDSPSQKSNIRSG